jgi:hypothetical protein
MVYLSASLLGLLVGASFALDSYSSMIKLYWDDLPQTAQYALDDFSVLQYKHADTDHARAALLTTAGFVEQLDEAHPNRDQKRDIAFTYARLSLLEDAAGNSSQSEAYMTEAKLWWKASSGRDVTDSEMKTAVKLLDAALHR